MTLSLLQVDAPKQQARLKVALLSLPARTQAVLEFFFSSTGRSAFAPVAEEQADAAVFDLDTLESRQHWSAFYARTGSPGIALSVQPQVVEGTVWVQKPVTPAALLAAAAELHAGRWTKPAPQESERGYGTAPSVVQAQGSIPDVGESQPGTRAGQDEPSSPAAAPAMTALPTALDSADPMQRVHSELAQAISALPGADSRPAALEAADPAAHQAADLAAAQAAERVAERESADGSLQPATTPRPTPPFGPAPTPAAAKATSVGSPDVHGEPLPSATRKSKGLGGLLRRLFGTAGQTERGLPVPPPVRDHGPVQPAAVAPVPADPGMPESILSGVDEPSTAGSVPEPAQAPTAATLAEPALLQPVQALQAEKHPQPVPDGAKEPPSDAPVESSPAVSAASPPHAGAPRSDDSGDADRLPSPATSDEPTPAPAAVQDRLTTSDDKLALLNEALLCGQRDDLSPAQWQEDPELRFDPDVHLIGALREAYLVGGKWQVPTHIECSLGRVVVDATRNLVLCDFDAQRLESIYGSTLGKRPKTRTLNRQEQSELLAQDFDAAAQCRLDDLLWRAGMLTAAGRLPVTADLARTVYLRHWPNLTRLSRIPNAVRIAALWTTRGASMLETCRELGISQRHVIAFYNGASALDLITEDGSHIQRAQRKAGRNRGLLTRLLGWLHR